MKPPGIFVSGCLFVGLTVGLISVQPHYPVAGAEYVATGDVEEERQFTTVDGKSFTAIPQEDGYRVLYDGESYIVTGRPGNIEVVFPDGRVVGMRYSDYSLTRYTGDLEAEVSGNDWFLVEQFYEVLYSSANDATSADGRFVLLGFLLIGVGALGALKPDFVWWLDIGWKIKNAEPSELGLAIARFTGIILVIIGIIFMAQSCN